MPYSLVSAATLGFDLVRLPAGGQVADVLVAGLGADAATLHRIAAAHPAAGRPDDERAALAVRARRAHELAAGGVPQLRDLTDPGGDDRSARLVALLERGTIGNTPALERLVRDDVLGPEHQVVADLDPAVAAQAADVLADAATGWWASDALDAPTRQELTGPFATATAWEPGPRPDLGPAAAGVDAFAAELRGLDEAGRRRWRMAVDAGRAQRRPWAAAMHGAAWAAHVSGRTRTLAAVQLMTVGLFAEAGFSPRDGAEGVWNALAGCVQGLAMADLLDEESLAVLGGPWAMVTGRSLPLEG
ncbi:hypothetical protein GCM10023328_06740 [Modestobacter marinus]|uniref:Uncharacterized protein n=1 Tax=Modestobacter marinus TaxID=477641 RepID=A0A846LNB0_9ACTN|nr:hypothetical protein [Modestobacter marinus]NIH66905.1 hypothetical protein [Modestobacter marinus]GGL50216.1 hypothetical protein GCM10011589_03220 [Modestobacter marinus]